MCRGVEYGGRQVPLKVAGDVGQTARLSQLCMPNQPPSIHRDYR
jgi:hypothetical protein